MSAAPAGAAPESVAAAIARGRSRLAGDARDAAFESALLLGEALGRSRAWLVAHAEAAVDAQAIASFDAMLERRAGGEPIAYVLGRREFWSLALEVDEATLIPRPETERLVERALEHLAPDTPARVWDLGTGSGAVALAIASERPCAHVDASDASAAALSVARRNAARLDLDNVAFHAGDWFDAIDASGFDLVVANPPYVADGDRHLERGDPRFEPRAALAAGHDGLDALRTIVAGAPQRLRAGGWLAVEHGRDQGAAVRTLLAAAGFEALATHADLAGHPRVSEARVPGRAAAIRNPRRR